MNERTVGFIGGGRVVRILLGGLRRAGAFPAECVVSDNDASALDALVKQFPEVRAAGADNAQPAGQDLVFGALHPPALKEVLPEIAGHLRPSAVFVSLAPKLRIADLKHALGGFDRIARLIPNAPSVVQSGFNPIALSESLNAGERHDLLHWLGSLGVCPEVPDADLEAYAILTAMGPTYFWFQFEELAALGSRFGLGPKEVEHALTWMLRGSVETFFASQLGRGEVMDLIPVKPLQPAEEEIRNEYRTRLGGLYEKLTG